MNALFVAILTYITTIAAIIVLKPQYFYHQGELKDFGVMQNQCIFPYYVTALGMAVPVYVLSQITSKK